MTAHTSHSTPDVHIQFNNLYVSDSDLDGSPIQLPLTQLPYMEEAVYQHIHGFLEIQVKGRKLPYLGFFSERDVCFNTWIVVLYEVQQALRTSAYAKYVFDEGEQGQPAFQFQRQDDSVYISIVDASIGDGKADPEWQHIACNYRDFDNAIQGFMTDMQATLHTQLKEYAGLWLDSALQGL